MNNSSDGAPGKLTRLVQQYSDTVVRIVAEAKKPGFSEADWAPLAEFVAVDEFERVGPYRDPMDWNGYLKMMTRWAGMSGFEATVRRVTEVGRLVFYDIEERQLRPEGMLIKNTMNVFEFNEGGKLRRLDVFQQCETHGRP